MLLEKPGEIVTREELRRRIWPSDTFVDFDGGVNNAIKRLREALGDRADTPRFIETLPRRGYRFIAPADGSVAATPIGQESPTRDRGSAVSGRRLRIGRGAGLAIFILLIALLGLGPPTCGATFPSRLVCLKFAPLPFYRLRISRTIPRKSISPMEWQRN